MNYEEKSFDEDKYDSWVEYKNHGHEQFKKVYSVVGTDMSTTKYAQVGKLRWYRYCEDEKAWVFCYNAETWNLRQSLSYAKANGYYAAVTV